MPRTAGTTLPGSLARQVDSLFHGLHGVLQALSRSCMGQLGWVPAAWPRPLPHHPQAGQVEQPLLPCSTSCPATRLSAHLELCPPLTSCPLDLPLSAVHPGTCLAILTPSSGVPTPCLPQPSSPPRWAPRRRQKAETHGVCSRRGRRRKKMESMT